MKFIHCVMLICLSIVMTGCISAKSYVDPKYGPVSYADAKKPAKPHDVKIDVEFQRNGEHIPRVDKELRANVEKVFINSGVVAPSANATDITIKVTCNNIADLKGAMAKGFGAGLTFGAAGTAVTDFYQITIGLKQGNTVVEKKYDHAIHTTIGNKAAPVQGVAPVKPVEAFGGVIEDVILQFITEMQSKNVLAQ
jgi:hypothetical protein